jgi:hypothetical protein
LFSLFDYVDNVFIILWGLVAQRFVLGQVVHRHLFALLARVQRVLYHLQFKFFGAGLEEGVIVFGYWGE